MKDQLKQLKEIATSIGLDSVVTLVDNELKKCQSSIFNNGYRPLSELVYHKYKATPIWVWCEYPAGGEGRWCVIKHIVGDYIYCEVEFIGYGHGMPQGAVAWREDESKLSPYKTENQRDKWREFIDISNHRRIKYE